MMKVGASRAYGTHSVGCSLFSGDFAGLDAAKVAARPISPACFEFLGLVGKTQGKSQAQRVWAPSILTLHLCGLLAALGDPLSSAHISARHSLHAHGGGGLQPKRAPQLFTLCACWPWQSNTSHLICASLAGIAEIVENALRERAVASITRVDDLQLGPQQPHPAHSTAAQPTPAASAGAATAHSGKHGLLAGQRVQGGDERGVAVAEGASGPGFFRTAATGAA
eukprot:scaffold33208_cov20-Tisochrysis_lutea.AAC.3